MKNSIQTISNWNKIIKYFKQNLLFFKVENFSLVNKGLSIMKDLQWDLF